MGYEKQIKIETFAKYLFLRPVPGSVPIFRYEKWERIPCGYACNADLGTFAKSQIEKI